MRRMHLRPAIIVFVPEENDDQKPVLDNPAGRLALFLQNLRTTELRTPATGNNGPWDNLAHLLGADRGDTARTLSLMAAVTDLPNQIEFWITNCPDISDKFISLLSDVREFLRNLLSNMQSNLMMPQENLITTMELISDQLHRYAPEPVPDSDELSAVRKEVQDLYLSIRSSEIDSDLASFLSDRIRSLLAAIDDFQISGVDAIRTAINETIGDIYVRVSVGDISETDEEVKKFGGHLMDILNKLSALINIPAAAITIGNVTAAAISASAPTHLHP